MGRMRSPQWKGIGGCPQLHRAVPVQDAADSDVSHGGGPPQTLWGGGAGGGNGLHLQGHCSLTRRRIVFEGFQMAQRVSQRSVCGSDRMMKELQRTGTARPRPDPLAPGPGGGGA